MMLTGVVALQEAVILQSAIDPLLTALFLLAWSRALLRGGHRAWLLSGLALALLGLNRPNALLLAALVLPAALSRSRPAWRGGGAVALGMLLALLPFGVREGVATGEWRLLPAHGGLNFFIGNHAEATGTYTVLPDVTPSMAGQREDTRRVAERAAGRSLTDGEVLPWFTMRGLTWWREAPADAARLFIRKLWLSVNAHELPVNHSYAWFQAEVAVFSVLVIGAWCLMPLGLTAVICGSPAAPPAVRAWRWFRWTMPLYLFGVALFFVVDRYRLPALPMAVVTAAPLLHALWEVWRVRGVVVVTVPALLLAFGVFVNWPSGVNSGEGEADVRMALHHIDSGHDDAGRRFLARGVERHPEPGPAWLRAGLAWQARGALPDAEGALREALSTDPDVPEVQFALAQALLALKGR